MRINFTKKQFEALIKIVYMGNSMVETADDESEENQFDELEEYVFSFAGNFGLDDYVVYDKQDKAYYPSQRLEEDPEVTGHIHRYDDYTFWEKLIFNLAHRDMADQYGEGVVEGMKEEERFVKAQPFAQKYEREFAKSGLKNLKIVCGE